MQHNEELMAGGLPKRHAVPSTSMGCSFTLLLGQGASAWGVTRELPKCIHRNEWPRIFLGCAACPPQPCCPAPRSAACCPS